VTPQTMITRRDPQQVKPRLEHSEQHETEGRELTSGEHHAEDQQMGEEDEEGGRPPEAGDGLGLVRRRRRGGERGSRGRGWIRR
jgi:hypothetical protein